MIETLSEKSDVVARKPHGCGLCGLSIPQGSTHYTQRNADGSAIWTWRAHTDCYSKINAYWAWCGIDEYDDIPHDEFRQFLASTSHSAGYASLEDDS